MKYATVHLPKVFTQRFEKFQPHFGYRSFSEFVIETVRDALRSKELVIDMEVEVEKDNE